MEAKRQPPRRRIARFGQFSLLWADMCTRMGLEVDVVDVPWGEGVPVEIFADKLKADKTRLDKERRVFKDKLKAARKKIEDMEAQQWEGGAQGNINLINFKKGKIVMDEDDTPLY